MRSSEGPGRPKGRGHEGEERGAQATAVCRGGEGGSSVDATLLGSWTGVGVRGSRWGGEGGEGIYLETGTLGVYCVCSAGDAARLRGELRGKTVNAPYQERRSCPPNASPDET